MDRELRFDEIGYWSEVKLEIVEKYATAYSQILSSQARLQHVYIDGFAGAGEHIRKGTRDAILGSPLRALQIVPAFREYFFVDLDGDKVEHLGQRVGQRSDVHILRGDCNRVLLDLVFPKVRWKDYRRGLCLLDPYGLDLDWELIATAGHMKTLDLFLNFPIMDANRNALWREPDRVSPEQAARFSRYWGDDSWRGIVYRPGPQRGLFGDALEKAGNDEVAQAFAARLRQVAGFANVPAPMAMRNTQGAVVYYLFFASQNDVANKIIRQIFDKYASRRQ